MEMEINLSMKRGLDLACYGVMWCLEWKLFASWDLAAITGWELVWRLLFYGVFYFFMAQRQKI